MTLDEAIKHCEEVVEDCDKEYMEHPTRLGYIEKFYNPKEYGDRYNQLADWLKELKKYREHETTTFKPIATDTRGYACQFRCTACDRVVSETYYMRPNQFDYSYCPYCGRPVESEDAENGCMKEASEGEWIIHFDDLFPEDSTQECSICHAEQYLRYGDDDNYCPNCGAKMKQAGKG